MPKAKDKPAQMRAVTGFLVGVRHVHEGEVFDAADELVAGHPDHFEPVPADDGAEG